MSLSFSPQMRLAALVGTVAVLALGGGVFLLGHKQPATRSDAPALSAQELIKRAHATHHVTSTPAHTKHAVKPPANATRAAKAERTVHPKPKPKPNVTLYQNLPSVLRAALRRSDVVVAAIFNPRAPDDQIAVAEAQAGARDAGVGFVTLNVLEQGDVAQLTKTYGLIDDPAVLVFRRPGVVVGRLNGFADRTTVAQAVENSAPGVVAASNGP